MTGTVTAGGRPAFVVNVEVFLHREGRWLLIRRSAAEAHAAGAICGVGGKVESAGLGPSVLEETARREVAEEIAVQLGEDVPLTYVESSLFVTDDGDEVVNVVFAAPVPEAAEPVAVSPDEVAQILWLTVDEASADPACQTWTRRALRRAAAAIGANV
jgi:8-oxo-dGTP pyrophosphatase MutT (NUDIX family)